MSQQIQVKAEQIIQLILQFLQENNFKKSFQVLQEEAGVTLNQINKKKFTQQLSAKNWPEVIQILSNLMLSQELFFTIYQYIIDCLIEEDKFQAAFYILQQVVKPNLTQLQAYREKIMRIQYIIEHPHDKSLYKNPPTSARQSAILSQILANSTQTQPQRLVKLLSDSLKYQVAEGLIDPSIKLDIFTGFQQQNNVEAERIIKQIEKTINYDEDSKITELKLSWSEEYLAIGGVDGLIELYNTKDYTLYDNEYQREGQMFFHDHPISLLQFNYTDDILASCDTSAIVCLWNLKNGRLLRKIQKESNINALCWGNDPSHLLIGYKQIIKLYGIRSCNMMKQYVGSVPQFASCVYCNQNRIYLISTMGSLTIFNYITQEVLFSLESKQPLVSSFRIFSDNISYLFGKILLAHKKKIIQVDEKGTLGKTYSVQEGELQNCFGVGQYLYMCIKGTDNKYRLSVVERTKKKSIFYTSLENSFQHMIMSRRRNLLITYDEKHRLSFWRPS